MLQQKYVVSDIAEEFIEGLWFCKVVTLQLIAAYLSDKFQMVLAFHAFHKSGKIQSFYHSYRMSKYYSCSRIILQRAQKAHIYLYHIEVIILQDVQGRISAAEVVHPDLKSLIVKSL